MADKMSKEYGKQEILKGIFVNIVKIIRRYTRKSR